VSARLDGHSLPADGAEVSVQVTGAALAFPAEPASTELVRGELTGPR
jgi:hypothetical protein